MKKLYLPIISLLMLVMHIANANTLSLPKDLIALNTPQGEALFYRSDKADYWPLSQTYVTQENLAYCAIASGVMVLNALNIQAPPDEIYQPYRMFTQDNFFTAAVQKILLPEQIKHHGVTLTQLGQMLATFPVKVAVEHANQTTLADFRKQAQAAVADVDKYIVVNFTRNVLQEEGFGHMSPLAAYDKTTDRFLVMDVARYKYPPTWMTTEQLWNAMNTFDKGANAYQGFIVISKV